MIKDYEYNNQIALEFGKGDICINGGYFEGDNKEKIGIVTFINQEPHEIGEAGIIKANVEYKIKDFPVIMTFTKVESIDAVIGQLLEAKSNMLKTEII